MKDDLKAVMRAAVEKNMPWTIGSKKGSSRLDMEPTNPETAPKKKKTRLGGEVMK